MTSEVLDWRRFDVHAVLSGRGLATIEPERAAAAHSWLRAKGYVLESLDFGGGVGPVVSWLGLRLRWEEEFGYTLMPDSRNLDALRDGFVLSEHWGADLYALELRQAERAWRDDPRWLLGFLAIAQEQSLCSLALGRRFFLVLVLERTSSLIGQAVDTASVPMPFWQPGPVEAWFKA